MSPSLPLAAVLMLATATAAFAQAAGPLPNGVSLLGRPHYDANEQGLRIPFAGAVPVWTRGTLKQPPRIFLDFDAPSRIVGVVSEGVPNHPVWLSWAMAPRDRVKTRLTLVFRRDTTINVRVDRAANVMWVVPRIPAPENSLKPSTAPDESLPDLNEPTPAPRRTPAVRLAPTPTPAPTMTPWVLPSAIAPAPTMTPWLPVRTPVPVSTPQPTPRPATPTMTPWLPTRTPSPLPSDIGSIYLPGSPDPFESPTITISTVPLLPTPAPVAPVPQPVRHGNGDTFVGTAIAYGPYEEMASATAVPARADNARVVGARFSTKLWSGARERVLTDGWLPWWGLAGDLYATDAIYRDAVSPAGLQARQAFRSHVSLTRGIRLSPLELQGGLGLQGRTETSWSSVPQLGVSQRTILAPELVALGRLPLAAGIGLYGEAAVAPIAFAWSSLPLATTGALTGTRFELGMSGDWSGFKLGLGYRHWSLNGGGYGEVFQGPVLTLGGWLDPETP